MKCPRCQLYNVGTAVNCDCGHNFQTGAYENPNPAPARYSSGRSQAPTERSAAEKDMLYGGLICLAGIVITVGTIAAASQSGGGSYFVAWGAIIFGGIRFLRGLANRG